ncbi:nuclease-related domain-containing DEAD/DEAH box helicase [Demequina rhizosphaerae]|uniref:nuclease-related domain-containing DEAD/DEAH box helicase n=1 Tax=Demequina rhizosphaerae TaxID=1638985 RepID=UPI000780F294|nr:UvrD-helicase domain-containing protein [Demequina rhizosphaerae]
MTAGQSAEAEAMRQAALAEQYSAAAAEARANAAKYGIAAVTEKRTMQVLAPLAAVGVHFLAERKWPGSRRAQVDLVAIGPQGVFIVDTKAWKDVSMRSGRIHRGDEDVTEDLMALADLADTIEGDLAEVGLAPGEVHAVAVLAGHGGIGEKVGPVDVVGEKDILRYIAARGNRLTESQVDVVLGRSLSLLPQVNAAPEPAPTLPAPAPTLPAPVVPAASSPEPEELISESAVESALLEGILAQPIEEWMSFLHPNQAKLVRRSFSGPSRIRGAAGTGKTVVGLHRAAYLARTRSGRILFATFVRTLPAVMRQSLGRMAPDVVDRVHFTGVHRFALDLLADRGVACRVDGRLADGLFNEAWAAVPKDSPLRTNGLTHRYWKDEIDHILKGRGITQFHEYADLPRTGRTHRLSLGQREAVWSLYRDYDNRLRASRIHDFADVILLAEAELKRKPLDEPYVAVVIDEAQDLSCAMVRMLHSLVGDVPDGLTLIGDGQQSIYPGGYTLAEAGISVVGRGVVMDVNYRNTSEILSFAHDVIAGSEYADIEGEVARGERPADVPRHGPVPEVARCASRREHDRLLVSRVREAVTAIGTGLGDVAVLCVSTWAARQARDALKAVGCPVVELESYDGSAVDAVKVGTIKRAKGLEFKQVLMPYLKEAQIGLGEPPVDGAERERWELERRELFVGATRARDGLWLGVVG